MTSRNATNLADVRWVSGSFLLTGATFSGSGVTASHTAHPVRSARFPPRWDLRFLPKRLHRFAPFSILYPCPQTTFRYRGSAGLISIFFTEMPDMYGNGIVASQGSLFPYLPIDLLGEYTLPGLSMSSLRMSYSMGVKEMGSPSKVTSLELSSSSTPPMTYRAGAAALLPNCI